MPSRERPLIVVANRLPVSKATQGWMRSSGGLVTALAPIMGRTEGAWIGWDGGSSDAPTSVPDMPIDMAPVALERADVNGYYHGFSNRTVWPLFHDLIQPARFDRTWWQHYVEVNRRFADMTRKQLKQHRDAVVWVHDYHLMLVPALLREHTDAEILFFLHIPFPPPELFARLPWRRDILEGLCGADVVSFHTDRYRDNFVRTCGQLIPDVRTGRGRITMPDGRQVLSESHPISIDAADFAERARSSAVEEERVMLRKQFGRKQMILGVDRLDYTKGIPERLEAFELLLERRSDLRAEVMLVQIAVPSRSAVREYRDLRERVEQIVGRINGRFTEPGLDVPIHYIHRGVSGERLVAYYSLADVMAVTPLKDGMNLVAKEYVASQGAAEGSGALLLSEFTGAALELPEAITCNPFDVEGLSRAMEHALDLDERDRRRRMSAMARRVGRNDVHRWATEVLKGASRER